jgi:hypothetical protein
MLRRHSVLPAARFSASLTACASLGRNVAEMAREMRLIDQNVACKGVLHLEDSRVLTQDPFCTSGVIDLGRGTDGTHPESAAAAGGCEGGEGSEVVSLHRYPV